MISFFITTYNRPRLLEKLFDSLLAQTSSGWEALIGDDNSSDGETPRLAAEFLAAHPSQPGFYLCSRVKEEERAKSCRYSVLINQLRPHAKGELFMYLCDDTELYPRAVEVIQGYFESHPQVNVGYVGQAIETADWVTGERISSRHDIRAGGLGKPLAKAFCVLDHSQVVHRSFLAQPWPEEPEHWPHADGLVFDAIIRDSGGECQPIGDVMNEPLVIYKETETSICRQPIEEALRKLREGRKGEG